MLDSDGWGKLDETGRLMLERDEIMHYPDLTDDHRRQVAHALLPASKELIITLLTRLSIHKRMEADPSKQIILFSDYADNLFGVPEYALALAVLDFVEQDVSDWFPNMAKMQKAVAERVVEGVSLKP